jgi:hypothetical protein
MVSFFALVDLMAVLPSVLALLRSRDFSLLRVLPLSC